MSDLKELIKEEHHRAEIERLRAGFDGCGCSDCQELYQTLDLSKYDSRVIRVMDIINVTAGKPGADLGESYHPLEPVLPSVDNQREPVSKILVKGIIPPTDIQAQETGIMKQRGRPKKEGKVSRVTAWRRQKATEVN